MEICIIVHSQTGHTLSVAQKLKERLVTAGHAVSLEQVKAIDGTQTEVRKIQLSEKPDVSSYDMLVLGAPVRGFSLSPVMAAYLSNGISLSGKKLGCFVTQSFPYPWMGGKQAIEQMKKLCESKGATVCESGIVNWSSKKREKKIDETVENLTKAVGKPSKIADR